MNPLLSSGNPLEQEVTLLRQQLIRLHREKSDLETLLEVAVEHSDYVEEELLERIESTLRENEQRFRLLSETMPIPVLVCQACDYTIVYANLPAGNLLGCSPACLLHQSIVEYFAPPLEQESLEDLLTRQRVVNDHEMQGYRKNGRVFRVLLSAQPLEFNREPCVLFVLYDMTERWQQEQRIRALNEELEQRVFERTAQLHATNKTLQTTLDNLQDVQEQLIQSEKIAALVGLTASIAHQINTPTGVSITAASHLLEKTQDLEELYRQDALKRSDIESYVSRAKEALEMVLRNLRQASSHIQHFKQIAVSQADFEEVVFNVRTYLEEVVTFLKIEYSHHAISLDCPDDIEMTSYPGIFLQVLSHLVTNSVQHGFERLDRGTITITITQEPESLVLRYHDNGKGIPPGVLEKIFAPFFTTKRGTGGNGLGMYIVYNLVTQKLKGQITGESLEGEGCTFTITIPK